MDRRARNRRVFAAAREAVRRLAAERDILRALEPGGGSGGGWRHWMRLVEPADRVSFLVVDRSLDLLAAYRREVAGWGRARRMEVGSDGPGSVLLRGGGRVVRARFLRARVPRDLAGDRFDGFDLLLAQSFWDLLPAGTVLPLARRLLSPGGVFYATLTFAGETVFSPALDGDRVVLARYHASMDRPGPDKPRGGDARAGLRLVRELDTPGSGFSELESGRSDWRVEPAAAGYPEDEAFFVKSILGFVEAELRRDPGGWNGASRTWVGTRRRQLLEGRLGFAAAQTDCAARREGRRTQSTTKL